MLGKLNDNQIINVLQSQLIGRIACYADNKPYIVPITYAYKDGYIYFHSKDGKKIDMMNKNPEVCVEVDQIDTMNSWRSVILWGKFEKITKEKEQAKAMQIIEDRIMPISTGETVVPYIRQDVPHPYRIKITEQTGRYEKLQLNLDRV